MRRRDEDMDRCATVNPPSMQQSLYIHMIVIPVYMYLETYQELAQLKSEIRSKNDAIREKQVLDSTSDDCTHYYVVTIEHPNVVYIVFPIHIGPWLMVDPRTKTEMFA